MEVYTFCEYRRNKSSDQIELNFALFRLTLRLCTPKELQFKDNRADARMFAKGFNKRLLALGTAHYQCDQIGRFLKVLGNKVPCKSSQKLATILGYCEKWHFLF